MFYIQQDDKIVLVDEDKQRLQNTIAFTKPQYLGLEIKETREGYTVYNFELVPIKEMEAKETQKEQDKINMLTMTALDFIGVLKSAGLTSQQIEDYLNTHLDVKHQLQYCQNVFCGVVRQLVPLEVEGITITDKMVVTAFKAKHDLI